MQDDWRKAAIEGDVGVIERRLLEDGQVLDSRDRYGQTALMLAAVNGRQTVVDLLLAQGAGLDVTAKYGLSALMLAILNRHTEIAAALIDAGANTRLRGTGAPGFSGKTASDLAKDGGFDGLAEAITRRDG